MIFCVIVCRQIFCDFGESFIVNDVNGEQPISVMVSAVTKVTGTPASQPFLLCVCLF